MRSDFHVVSIDFDTPEFHDWQPDDPQDCEVWATVSVGDYRGTALFYVHICTPSSMPRIDNKRHCFTIKEFRGVPDLVERLNAFIEERIPAHAPGDPYYLLSKHWLWEYERKLRLWKLG
jgi:hypothetical protein